MRNEERLKVLGVNKSWKLEDLLQINKLKKGFGNGELDMRKMGENESRGIRDFSQITGENSG